MNAIIDTSSLRALVNYYLPIDSNNALKDLLVDKFTNGELVIIDTVVTEIKYQGGGRFYEKLDFIHEDSPLFEHVTDTKALFPSSRFITRVDDHFCHKEAKKAQGLDASKYEILRNRHIETADIKLILLAEKTIKTYSNKPMSLFAEEQNSVLVVSEESSNENDGKLFKKIPTMCKQMNIEHCSLPDLLIKHYGLGIDGFHQ